MLTKCDCVVQDEETYVKVDFKQFSKPEFYTATELLKFAQKYLVWQAICTCGLKSNIYIATVTVNQGIYVSECLQKRLLPFLKRHNCYVLFWPDLTSLQCRKKAMEWHAANNV